MLEFLWVLCWVFYHIIFILLLSIIVYNLYSCSDLEVKDYIIALVTIITSVTIGGFFLVRVYVENQLGIKEKQMIKEYEDHVNKRFDNMITREQLQQQLQEQTQQLQPVIDWANQQIAKEQNKQEINNQSS